MAKITKSKEALGIRLIDMLTRLNEGEILDIHSLKDDYGVSLRTVQRDINRLSPILNSTGSRHYFLDRNKHGQLSKDEIRRFCTFASIEDLFPEPDRRFFQEKLKQSITVKGFQYEDISDKEEEFELINDAIHRHHPIAFDYVKVRSQEHGNYSIEPYHMVNKNGIWYVIGLDGGKQKSFCFNQISNLQVSDDFFTPDKEIAEYVRETDSIYFGNQHVEVIIKISAKASGYFKRRALLPNQEIVRELEDGTLLLACNDVSPMEILPIVQYWIPHVHIVSPEDWQDKIRQQLVEYLEEI